MKHSNRVRDLATVTAAVALTWGTLAASAGTYFIPYFPGAAQNCAIDSCPNNGEIRLVNRSASSTTVTLSGRDMAGVSGGDDFVTDSIPGHGSLRVTDTQLEAATRWRNGSGPWSITVTVPDGKDVVVVPFRYNRGGGAIEVVPLPVVELEETALRLSRLYAYKGSGTTGTWRVLAHVRYPQTDRWDSCQGILMRPNGQTGVFLPVTASTWTTGDLITGDYATWKPYNEVMTTGIIYFREGNRDVDRSFRATVRDPLTDSVTYQVRLRCLKTSTGGTVTYSPVVQGCYRINPEVNPTAAPACPAA